MPRKASPDQGDLFFSPVYPSRVADQSIDLTGFRGKLKRGMSRALKDCAHERPEVAMRIATALGQDSFSLATLNAYTAVVRATRATWLWDLVVADDGLTMLIGDEARLAEIARVQQERAALDDKLKELKAKPVHILRRDRA